MMTPAFCLLSLASLFPAGLAIFIAFREDRHPTKYFLIVALLLTAVLAGLEAASLIVLPLEAVVRLQRWHVTLASLVPWFWLLLSLTFARGNYLDYLRRWGLIVAVGGLISLALCIWNWNGLLPFGQLSPQTGLWVFFLSRLGAVQCVIQMLLLVVGLMQFERTLRAATGAMRWRIKFAILGFGTFILAQLYSASESLLYMNLDLARYTFAAVASLAGSSLLLVSLKRGRLRDTDLYLSHKAIIRSITVLLAGLYLLLVGGLAQVLTRFEQELNFPLVAVALLLAMLALAWFALSDRLRQSLRRLVSRHFRRPVYDYRAIWEALTARTASLVDPISYCRANVKFLAETMDLHSASIWIIDEQHGDISLGASTTLTAAQALALMPPRNQLPDFIEVLRTHTRSVNIDTTTDSWVDILKAWSPEVFKQGAGRVCMPLHAGGEVVGLLTLGDRINGEPFAPEDYDFIDAVGAQLAAGLLTLALTARVADVHERQAFETMSAFLIHDLKNTASTLGLMLQNMPVHFDDPAFRADALQAMSRCVAKINDVIRRLMTLRFKPELHRVETDLNALLQRVVAEVTAGSKGRVEASWGDLPSVRVDPEELQKVAANLFLNAIEASRGDDHDTIHVDTYVRGARVLFAVRDHGCGIAPEFLERCLFRPFKTTKKQGMGIGLYQSQLIVEAHGGKISVETAVGQGSTFTVSLPI
ncbi:MAG: PEP-CTERM system histidine kinase PrsK [Lentisphaerae bacterium]|nr:PEP-CTERM system histidine kinase PrsK [Lentisphaerota bacterium]